MGGLVKRRFVAAFWNAANNKEWGYVGPWTMKNCNSTHKYGKIGRLNAQKNKGLGPCEVVFFGRGHHDWWLIVAIIPNVVYFLFENCCNLPKQMGQYTIKRRDSRGWGMGMWWWWRWWRWWLGGTAQQEIHLLLGYIFHVHGEIMIRSPWYPIGSS